MEPRAGFGLTFDRLAMNGGDVNKFPAVPQGGWDPELNSKLTKGLEHFLKSRHFRFACIGIVLWYPTYIYE